MHFVPSSVKSTERELVTSGEPRTLKNLITSTATPLIAASDTYLPRGSTPTTSDWARKGSDPR